MYTFVCAPVCAHPGWCSTTCTQCCLLLEAMCVRLCLFRSFAQNSSFNTLSDFHDRHDKPLSCWYNALAAVTLDQVQKGDKAECRHNGKYKRWNAGHVPDILHLRLEVDELLQVPRADLSHRVSGSRSAPPSCPVCVKRK